MTLPVFNDTIPNGGNPQEMNVNLPYTGLEFHYIYQVILGCMVFLIVPGLGLLYGGMSKRKSALAMIFQSITVMSVITFQWMLWGYTLAFSRTGSPFIGDFSEVALKNVSRWAKLCECSADKGLPGHGCTILGQRPPP